MNIIATIGPNSMSKKVLHELINAGITSIRLNFSHFREEEFINVIKNVRSIKNDISIIGDLCGKKIRVYEKINNIYKIYKDEIIYFCSEDVYHIINNNSNEKIKLIPLTIKSEIIEKSDISSISIKDGTMNFEILEKDKIFLKTRSKNNGIIRGGKGCNLIGINYSNEFLNNKDKTHIKWMIKNNISTIYQSFVENKEEVLEIKRYIKEECKCDKDIRIISKIETSLGLDNYEEILQVSDGIVIARGDMIPECGIINSVNKEFSLLNNIKDRYNGKEVIVATHLLDNMKYGNMASINEVESIYTFIKLGVNGFLLAGETSIGKNPVETVEFLKKLIESYKI